jgi:hypothetical protein
MQSSSLMVLIVKFINPKKVITNNYQTYDTIICEYTNKIKFCYIYIHKT